MSPLTDGPPGRSLQALRAEIVELRERLRSAEEELRGWGETGASGDGAALPEAALERQHARLFSRLIEQAPMGMYLVDDQFRLTQVNALALPVFKNVEPLLGRDFAEVMEILWGPQVGAQCTAVFRHTLATGERYVSPPFTERRHDLGEEQTFEWETQRVQLPNGAHGVVCYFHEVTERARTERARREGEARLRLGTQVAGLALADTDYARGTYRLTAGAAQLYGLGDEATEVPHEVVHAAFHPDDRAMMDRLIAECRDPAGTGWIAVDHRVIGRGGEVRWVRVHKQVFFEGEGAQRRPVRGMLASYDVTAEKTASEKVRASEELVTAVLNSLPEHVVVLDERGVVRATNEAWEVFARTNGGCPLAVSVGVDYLQVCRAASLAGDGMATEVLQKLKAVLSGTLDGCVVEYPCHGPGVDRWFLMHAERVRHGPPGVILSHVDITARRQAEKALRESEERLRMALGAAHAGVWEWSLETGVVTWSQENFGLHGRDPALGAPAYQEWERILHPEDLAATNQAVQRALSGETESFFAEFRVRVPAVGERWLLGLGRVHRAPDGRPLRMSGLNLDITERKTMEAALRQAKEQAEAASRAKDQFLATLSHELRTPLTPVLFLAGAMEKSPQVPPELREDFAMIRRNVEMEARLIDDLLDLTRVERGKLQLQLEPLDAHVLLNEALATVEGARVGKEITCVMVLGASEQRVQADPVRLPQIFWNVLNNAVKFTPAGGAITVRTRNVAPRRLEIEVADTGLGLTPEEIARLFEPFAQGDHAGESGSSFGGLGLGLAITHELVGLHGGTIRAQSPGRGRGSTFIIDLPLAEAPDAAAIPAAGRMERRAVAPAAGTPRRLLLVEDHPQTRLTLSHLLRNRGYDVTGAATPQEAREAAQAAEFDAVICDIGLPECDGRTLLAELRSMCGPHLRAVAVSGFGMPVDVTDSIAAGFTHHLVKPFDLTVLERVIEELWIQPL